MNKALYSAHNKSWIFIQTLDSGIHHMIWRTTNSCAIVPAPLLMNEYVHIGHDLLSHAQEWVAPSHSSPWLVDTITVITG